MADAASTSAWTFGASILSFAFPMLLFIFVASALYVLYTKPEYIPGHPAPGLQRPVSYTPVAGPPAVSYAAPAAVTREAPAAPAAEAAPATAGEAAAAETAPAAETTQTTADEAPAAPTAETTQTTADEAPETGDAE
jgi:hypothetical protein